LHTKDCVQNIEEQIKKSIPWIIAILL